MFVLKTLINKPIILCKVRILFSDGEVGDDIDIGAYTPYTYLGIFACYVYFIVTKNRHLSLCSLHSIIL